MSLIDTALDFARAFLRTPLEQAEISAVPAGERLLDAIKAHFETPQGLIDKQTFETLGTLVGASLASDAAPTRANAVPEPPAHVGGHPHGDDSGLMPPGV